MRRGWRPGWGGVGDSEATEQKPYIPIHGVQQFNPWVMPSGGGGQWPTISLAGPAAALSTLDTDAMESGYSVTPSKLWAVYYCKACISVEIF